MIKKPIIAIEQIDGQMESDEPTITIDLTISAVQVVDAYCSMEDNLCYGEVDKKVLFIGDETSSEIKEANSDNTLFTFEIQVENEETFLVKLQEWFDTWDPLYNGKPCGKLVKWKKEIEIYSPLFQWFSSGLYPVFPRPVFQIESINGGEKT